MPQQIAASNLRFQNQSFEYKHFNLLEKTPKKLTIKLDLFPVWGRQKRNCYFFLCVRHHCCQYENNKYAILRCLRDYIYSQQRSALGPW